MAKPIRMRSRGDLRIQRVAQCEPAGTCARRGHASTRLPAGKRGANPQAGSGRRFQRGESGGRQAPLELGDRRGIELRKIERPGAVRVGGRLECTGRQRRQARRRARSNGSASSSALRPTRCARWHAHGQCASRLPGTSSSKATSTARATVPSSCFVRHSESRSFAHSPVVARTCRKSAAAAIIAAYFHVDERTGRRADGGLAATLPGATRVRRKNRQPGPLSSATATHAGTRHRLPRTIAQVRDRWSTHSHCPRVPSPN